MILYTYFRSSAAYRVRIALELKSLQYESRYVHLLRHGGEQTSADYRRLNPLGRVPTLIDGDAVLTQSIAILEYLEEKYPSYPILPSEPLQRAWVRSLVQIIAADMQPLQNLSTVRYLSKVLSQPSDAVDAWVINWMTNGFAALELLLKNSRYAGKFCCGDAAGAADICLVAQVFSARRYGIDFAPFPILAAIDARCREIPAFEAASPGAQKDFEA